MAKYDVVSFLSDMGTRDESVGVCKAIIVQQAPGVQILDITHDIPAFDVRAGALALTRAIQFLPTGIVIAAVDPGAPKDQRFIAVEMETGILLGPDNGILAPAAQLIGEPKRVHEITNPEYRIEAPGAVFAARDILAPAAGVIAAGTDIATLGNAIALEELVPGMLQLSRHDEGGALLGEVWSLDIFGNVQLNITPDELAERNAHIGDTVTVRIGEKDFMAKYVERYADLAVSQLGILVDSTGMISVVKNHDNASRELEVKEGKAVIVLAAGTSVTGRDVTVEDVAPQTTDAPAPAPAQAPPTPTPSDTVSPFPISSAEPVPPVMTPGSAPAAPPAPPLPEEQAAPTNQQGNVDIFGSFAPTPAPPVAPPTPPAAPPAPAPQTPPPPADDVPPYFPPADNAEPPTPDVAPRYVNPEENDDKEDEDNESKNVFDLFKLDPSQPHDNQ